MNQETILIVEDNGVLREGMCEMLGTEGFRVLSAGNGIEALELMKNELPDLIVSDINMPKMNGFEFFNAVRAQNEWVTIPIIFLTARSESNDVSRGRKLGAEDYLTKPIGREELVSTIHSRLNRSKQIQMAQLQLALEASLSALANAIEARDPRSSNHVNRVTEYTVLLGRYLGWSQLQIENLRFGAILHDLGKIHITEDILFKSEPLNEAEWELVKQHPTTGARMVQDVPHLVEVVPIVKHHHERWDGKGYPDRLSGNAIPEGARIVTIADALDAMTTSRPYSSARTLEEAYQELLSLAGINYDPEMVNVLQQAWQDGKIQTIYNNYQ
jgi:putative two-component system response regulator